MSVWLSETGAEVAATPEWLERLLRSIKHRGVTMRALAETSDERFEADAESDSDHRESSDFQVLNAWNS